MTLRYPRPEDAEDAFYEAIGRGDLEGLMAVWAEDEEIVCIHPTGLRLVGPTAIRENWRAIFAGNPRFSVRISRSVRWDGMLLAVHSVIETLYLDNQPTPHGPMLATNVFQRGPNGWRLLSHHSSASADAGRNDSDADEAEAVRTPHTLH